MYRYKLPIVIIIVNNGGIYAGLDADTYKDIRSGGDLTKTYVFLMIFSIFIFFHFQIINFDSSIFMQLNVRCFFPRSPPSALTVETRYDAMLGMFGHSGYFVRTIPELRKSLTEALKVSDRPTIVNVIIAPSSERKAQSFNWLTESKL